MDKTELYGEFFLRTISSMPFYRALPENYQKCPLTILVNSYKRVHNFPEMLKILSIEDESKFIEIIIWNNNEEESTRLKHLTSEFKDNFLHFEIINSSENHFCITRSAVSHLAKGEKFLIIDDDVVPKKGFIKFMLDSHSRVEK